MLQPRPQQLPILETARLRLRPMRPGDTPALFAIYGDPEVMRYASDDPFPDEATVALMLQSVADLLASGESLEWGIADTETDHLIGTCGLHSFDEAAHTAEVGCMLARAAWGQGLMQEALGALFRYAADDLGVEVLRADIDAPNSTSIRLFTRLGFVHEHDTIYSLQLKPAENVMTTERPLPPIRLDHCVIHVADWKRSNAFYRDVLGAELIARGAGWAYRFGATQLNLHGPGVAATPLARLPVQPGGSDLCFVWPGPIAEAVAHLERHAVAIELGPVERFGAGGQGTSVYFRDPDGSLLEFISYEGGVD